MPTLTFNRDSTNDIIDSSTNNIADAITAAQGRVADCYTAISNKGGTLPTTQNLANMPTAISSIPSGGSGGKYKLFQRISDDNGNEIGTVSGFFIDANDLEYAVVCLDSRYRLASGQWCNNNSAVTNMPLYNSIHTGACWGGGDTATENCDKILAFCAANSYTSSGVSHCRSKSFDINSTTYLGQLPNIAELIDIFKNHYILNNKDSSASSSGSSLNFTKWKTSWSSTQYNASNGWLLTFDYSYKAAINGGFTKDKTYFICPVLEIPNQ